MLLLRIEGAARRVNFAASQQHEKFESRPSALPMHRMMDCRSRAQRRDPRTADSAALFDLFSYCRCVMKLHRTANSSDTSRFSSHEPSKRNDLVSAATPFATLVIT